MCSVRTVHRTARVGLRVTRAQRRRCYGLLWEAGNVRAWLLDCNRQLRAWGYRPVTNYQALCRELARLDRGSFGELDSVGARSVLRRYATEWHTAARRRRAGERVGYPRRKKALVPIRYYSGTFRLQGGRLRLPTARGSAPLWVRLSREPPYPPEAIRSVTLLCEAGRLFVDVTAQVPVAQGAGERVAGVDPGIIHPLAVAVGEEALLVSGRALRAEARLHLEDAKRRARHLGRKARGSRRWKRLRANQRRAEARHRRRIRQAHHRAARQVVAWAAERGVGTLVVGDPQGITTRPVGRHHNLRLRQWRRTHLLSCLRDKAEVAGMEVVGVDERGTSSTCPECGARTPKPTGRNFYCPSCGHRGHRDLVGARNIAARGGGTTSAPALVTHRRAGSPPARRDRRRHLWEVRRSCPAPGRPGPPGSRSPAGPHPDGLVVSVRSSAGSPATGEDPLAFASLQEGERLWTEH